MTGKRDELLRRRLSGRAAKRAPLATAKRSEYPALSYGQRRIWFVEQLQPGTTAYSVPVAHRLRGLLDPKALEGAFALVIQRHEALRTRFRVRHGEPYQVVDAAGPAVRHEDLSSHADPEGEARKIVDEEANRAFDLAAGPLLRALLLRLGPSDHVLMLVAHHIVFDAWSLGVLTRELSEAYAALCEGREPDLPALPVQYADFAAWQREHLTADRLSGHLDYWREQLAGAPTVLELPADRARPESPSFRGGSVTFTVPGPAAEGLRELARSHSASLFVVMLAAYQVVLGRNASVPDLLVAVPVAGRGCQELEGLIGFFAHTLPLRARLERARTFDELLLQVRDTVLDGMSHEELPFEQLVEHLSPARELSRNPIAQVLFNLLTREAGTEQGALKLPGLHITEFTIGPVSTRFDLELHVFDHGSELLGKVIYAADLFDHEAMRWFADHFLKLVTMVVSDPSVRISDISLISDAEMDLIRRWNAASDVI